MDAAGIEELFEPVGPVQLKRMFGGHGIYREGRIVALEANGMIWLKADDVSKSDFEKAGSRPFTYDKKGGGVTAMSYWLLPEAAFEDSDVMRQWVRLAEAAADRAAAKGAGKAASKPQKPKAKSPRKI
jgi:DNA transformation protein and related proteins